ncbi:SET domain-containing protein SmydA-8-like [Thrips palmi]|uniref:SET domain-containing protein SmydA-8-like n=1 Tax=Thrips palmi TaxID=161013 RepID=A0A6P8Z1L3_THRPL|nr:SET domain-containing protein SmydA-8-like [Thrips palmi]XP_034246364.1 SET domain-containing protein SmydA-8-like [Thrips palmi]XP_034246365.1 SET domain-containing protein SmydA-8-like [Thrips palmi]XP_034246366.1 SET domain-containing protein SmydA-8-like [Thrips palmi]XP_034246367.1 SET domain-containing protein SmydA-8-like [Thrips palmi]XP_034246368.1 SET domain-containing protein SmydA-8-like [Thrips palmi]XP_034246369.1 SET domain-containing protein SmydA-8-like [Thrips palmi]XP_0
MAASRPLTHNPGTGPCAVCGETGLPCARCRVDYYCSKEHQKRHWPKHKVGCGSVELRGGSVVAARDIPAGTVIMREVPALFFPASPLTYYQSQCLLLLCVGCCAELTPKAASQCRRCGLPVCGNACSRASEHQVECKAFERAKFKVTKADIRGATGAMLGAAVATLRVVSACSDNQLLQNLLREPTLDGQGLQASPDAASWVDTIETYIAAVALFLREVAGIKWIPEQDLIRAARIVSMYAEDFEGPDPARWSHVSKQEHVGTLYVGMAQRKHSCYPNSGDTIMNAELKEWVVVTSRDVAAGAPITTHHQRCRWLDDTLQRRETLLVRKGIVCDCERCSDPTELGVYVGSPCCAGCTAQGKQRYLVPVKEDRDLWRCEGCPLEMTVSEVKALTKPMEDRLEELKGSPPETILQFTKAQVYPHGPLHSTHTVVLRANEYLRKDIYDRRADEQATEGEVDRWEEVVRGQLRALDRLLPGVVGEDRAVILLELRRLTLRRLRAAERKAALEAFCQPSRTTEAGLKLPEYRQAVLDVNKQLCGLHFNRDEEMPKRFLIEDPFGGR